MPEDSNDLIAAYSKDPVGNYKPTIFSCSATQSNSICGDSITVYLLIDDAGSITDFGYEGAPSMFTITAASLLAEALYEKKTSYQELLSRNYSTIESLGFAVSPRRQRSAVTALLAARNAVHLWLGDAIVDNYEDLL